MKYSILLTNNNRSKAYLQSLTKGGFSPAKAIVLDAGNMARPETTASDQNLPGQKTSPSIKGSHDAGIFFDENEHVMDTLKAAAIDSVVLPTMEVNSEAVISEVRDAEGDYLVYSGPGGTILRKEILGQGKQFIHVHPGWLPAYRGSTTVYYSLLVDKTVSCSVFLMRESLDAGPLVYQKKFLLTDMDLDFDYVLDPAIRASTLMEFFSGAQEYLDNQWIQPTDEGDTFYIIHPVLKHMAILGVKGNEIESR